MVVEVSFDRSNFLILVHIHRPYHCRRHPTDSDSCTLTIRRNLPKTSAGLDSILSADPIPAIVISAFILVSHESDFEYVF